MTPTVVQHVPFCGIAPTRTRSRSRAPALHGANFSTISREDGEISGPIRVSPAQKR